MAKNYTFKEAVAIIATGKDLEAITDIGRRYPVLAHKVAVVAAKAGEEFVDLMSYMPDYLTANKVNNAIKASITESGSDDADDAEDTKATTKDETEANPYEGKSAMELFKECKARKIKAAPKKPAKYYVDLLVKDDAAKAKAIEAESDDEDWGDEEVEAPKKEDKKAAKSAAKGGKAKATKKAEAESEDDDDWDI